MGRLAPKDLSFGTSGSHAGRRLTKTSCGPFRAAKQRSGAIEAKEAAPVSGRVRSAVFDPRTPALPYHTRSACGVVVSCPVGKLTHASSQPWVSQTIFLLPNRAAGLLLWTCLKGMYCGGATGPDIPHPLLLLFTRRFLTRTIGRLLAVSTTTSPNGSRRQRVSGNGDGSGRCCCARRRHGGPGSPT